MFPLKDKNYHKSCVIYKGDCPCGSLYIGETKSNAEVRWNEHNNPTKSSESSKHLRSNINHYFTWATNLDTPKMLRPGRTKKHYVLLSGNKILTNKRTNFERLVLFKNGVT